MLVQSDSFKRLAQNNQGVPAVLFDQSLFWVTFLEEKRQTTLAISKEIRLKITLSLSKTYTYCRSRH
jgi:hypothetical protein